jgi:uncharacterized protein
MRNGYRVMDSDLHVIEGTAVFDDYLDERWRDLGPRYEGWGPTGFPWWTVTTPAGAQSIPPWARSADVASAQAALHGRNDDVYAEAKACGYDPASTLRAMDTEGIDVAVMFRTFASMVLSLDDLAPAHADAVARAFNDWLRDYCASDPVRLRSSAIVSLHDPELAAAEARRAVGNGAIAVVVLPIPVAGRNLHAPECDVLWAEIARLGVPLCLHGTSGAAAKDYVSNRFTGFPNQRTLNHASAFGVELMLAFGALAVGGVLSRFPTMRVALLEGNLGWLPWWLDRLDDQWHKYGAGETVALDALPSEYFRRQCWIGADIDERFVPMVADLVGADRIVVSTDYPHQDGPYPHAVEELIERTDLGPELLRSLLWDNCAALYGLGDGPA